MAKKAASGDGSIRKKTRIAKGNQYTYWEARITTGTDPGTGKQIQKSVYGKTQAEVRKKMREITRAIDQGTFTDTDKIKLSSWLDSWLEIYCRNTIKASTFDIYAAAVKNHIKPALGNVQLQKLTGVQIQMFYNQMLANGLSPKTIKNTASILHKALAVALKQGFIVFNPCNNAELPKQERKEIRPLSTEEISMFLDRIQDSEYKNAYMLCLFAGLREGECLGLSWDQIDFANKTITINRQLQKSKSTGVYAIVNSTKSGKPRTITPPAIAFKVLEEERTLQLKKRLKAGPLWDHKENLVFTDPAGGFISFQSFYKRFKKAAAEIGRPDARPHDLRHTAATVALANGADIKSVQSLLGHATASFTLDIYAHTTEEMQKDTAAKMENYYSQFIF